MPARLFARRVVPSVIAGSLLVLTSVRAQAQECVPQCRLGFVCAQGQCVSACNPPCAANQQCTQDAQCVGPSPAPQVAPAPSAAGPYAAPPGPYYTGTPPSAAPPPAAGPSAGPAAYAPPPVLPAQAPPAEREASGKRARTHDGFYLQFALGVGYVSGNAESQGSGGIELELTGVGQLGQLAIGGTVAPGLVIGGGIYGVNVFAGKYAYGPKNQDDFNKIEEDAEFSAASMIGPFVAYYFNPERGAYVVGAPAYTIVSGGKSEEGTISESSGNGFGLMLGAGYDFWVGDQWSVGALARFQYFSAELEDDDDDKVDFSAIVPGALFSVTYH